MEKLTINKNTLTFRDQEYEVIGYRKVDDQSFLLVTDKGEINFLFGDTEINGTGIKGFDSIPVSEIIEEKIEEKIPASKIDLSMATDEQLIELKQRLDNLK